MQKNNLDILQKNLKYKFEDENILIKSLTHPSFANEHNIEKYNTNQRLEFLGDSILGFIVADYIYNKYPNHVEGELTKLRSKMVCEEYLSKIAIELELYKYLYLGKSETEEKVKNNNSILCDSMECIIAAIYKDSGLENAKKFVDEFIIDRFDELKTELKDYKSILQEYCNKEKKELKYVELTSTGPAHNKTFEIGVEIDGKLITKSFGHSKKQAEQEIAKQVINMLNIEE